MQENARTAADIRTIADKLAAPKTTRWQRIKRALYLVWRGAMLAKRTIRDFRAVQPAKSLVMQIAFVMQKGKNYCFCEEKEKQPIENKIFIINANLGF